jgi:hypothetical protein
VGGWMGGLIGEWMEVKAVLCTAIKMEMHFW